MTTEYKDSFKEALKSVSKKSKHRFEDDMQQLEDMNILHIPLNEKMDSPLPQWVWYILKELHISKRTKLFLIKYHANKIKEFRVSQATQRPTSQYADDYFVADTYNEDEN